MIIEKNFFNHDAQAGGFFPMAHVGIDVSSFGNKQNMLIEGIRGTGKTHILKMIERYHLENFEKERVIPVYVSLAQISEHARKDPDEFRLHLYVHIVDKTVETVNKYSSYLQPNKSLLSKALKALTVLFGLKKEKNIFELLKQIRETAEYLKFKLQFDLTSNEFKKTEKEKTELEKTSKSKLGLKKAGINGAILNAESEKDSYEFKAEELLFYVGSRLAHHNAADFVIEFLKQVQVLLNLEHSLILLDECSEAKFESQIEIFRFFKTIRGADSIMADKDSCAFFVGSVYPSGETYYPIRDIDGFSFEPGQDCTLVFLQWDEIDRSAYFRFFEEMTLSRSKHLLGYEGEFGKLKDTIFDQEKTFLLAAICANGIPRRYWELLKQAYNDNIRKITFSGLEIAIQEIVISQILSQRALSEPDRFFLDCLMNILNGINGEIRAKNKKYNERIPQNIYFSVKRDIVGELRKLIMQGAIHEKSRMRTTERYSRPQPIFAIDMAVAYSFRIIPQKTFVDVIITDIPRCPLGDFNKSPFLKVIAKDAMQQSQQEGVYMKLMREKEKRYDESLDESKINMESLESEFIEGIIKRYEPFKKFGFIEVNDNMGILFFHRNDIVEKFRKIFNPGDKVKFNVRKADSGWRAINIDVIQMVEPLLGKINFVKSNKGTIEVEDGSPDVFFSFRYVENKTRSLLEVGRHVSFYINNTITGRKAINIRIVE